MTENASGRTPTLTDHERTVWGVNYQLEMDRHDLAAELADPTTSTPPAPVERGTRAAHRVALRRRAYRR